MMLTKPYRVAFQLATLLLAIRILIAIVWEYRLYFPTDFSATFLIGRQQSFAGWYAVAFYAHIIFGPLVLMNAFFLVFAATGLSHPRLHRVLGKCQFLIVVGVLVPSGLVMASRTFGGPLAHVGFVVQALLTGACVSLAGYFGWRQELPKHRRWAVRSLILLGSPLLLRLVGGASEVLELHSSLIYPINAWLSWLIPLVGYEVWRKSYEPRKQNARVFAA